MTTSIKIYPYEFIVKLEQEFKDKLNEKIVQNLSENEYVCQRGVNKTFVWRKGFNDTNESKEDLLEEIKQTLNKLSKSNKDKLSINIKLLLTKEKKFVNYLIEKSLDIIFEMAIRQPIFCKLYASLIIYLNKNIDVDVKDIILNKCNSYYGNNITKYDKSKNYDSLCKNNSSKNKCLGNFQLIGELYINNLIDTKPINQLIDIFFKNIENNNIDYNTKSNYISGLKKLIHTVGFKFINIEKKNLLKLFSKDKINFKHKERFDFMDILDLY